jgi:mycothiol synthase
MRPFRNEDVPTIVALINGADAIDHLDYSRTEDEIRASLSMPGSDPLTQAVIVEGPQIEGVPSGVPLGWGRYVTVDDQPGDERIYQFGLLAHPAARPYGVELAITRRIVEMIRDHNAQPERPPIGKVSLISDAREERTTLREALGAVGLREVRQGWVMEMPLDGLAQQPAQVAGVRLRAYEHPEDDRRVHEAYDNSFIDHFEYHALPAEMFDYMMSRPAIRHDISWLAEVEGEPGKIAGFCVCAIKEDENRRKGRSEGWIELLGTIRGWRGKGLGRSLLLHGLHSLKSAGIETALLGVDSESPTGANRLYESVGFRVRQHDILFKCALEEART